MTVELLKQLHAFYPQIETHLVVTKGGEMTLREETDLTIGDLKALATYFYDNDNIGAAIASGSFHTMGMAVVPCSMKTVAGIVSGYSDNLLLRAADVCMKERRKLVLVPREAPLSTLHLRNLYEASQLGAVVLPPMQTYYDHPRTVEDMTRHTVERILSQFGLETQPYEWTGINM